MRCAKIECAGWRIDEKNRSVVDRRRYLTIANRDNLVSIGRHYGFLVAVHGAYWRSSLFYQTARPYALLNAL